MLIADLENVADILAAVREGQISVDLALVVAYQRGAHDGMKIYEDNLTAEMVDEYLYDEELSYEPYEPKIEEEP